LTISVAEVIARELESQITGGALQPGERLGTKEDLRHRFRVSGASINEATKLLMMRGLLMARPGPGGGLFATHASRRVQVNHLVAGRDRGLATIPDLLCVRDALEPLVCREAARYHRSDDVRRLERLLAQMEQHLDQPRTYMRHSWALHRHLANLSRNTLLRSLYLTLLDYLEDALERAGLSPQDRVAHLACHRGLVEAIDAGPGGGLEAAIARHQPDWILRQVGTGPG
jgi:DNA-binding FadR family transcriptional regulator